MPLQYRRDMDTDEVGTRLLPALRIITLWLAGLVAARWVLQRNGNFLFLLLLAWLLAIAMDPAIRWFCARGLRRGLATGAVMLSLGLASAAFLAAFGGVLFSQAASFIQVVPDVVTNLVDWANTTFNLALDPAKVVNSMHLTPTQVAVWAGSFAGGVLGLLSTLIGGVFQLLTLLLFAYYFAAEGPAMKRLVASWLSPSAQKVFMTTWDIAVQKTGGFVVTKVVMAIISTVAHSTFFALLGIPYWLPVGMLTGIVGQFIPTVGTYIGVLVPMMVAAFENPINMLWIALFASIYQQIENYVLSPRISRRTMQIHPAGAFASVIVFANLFGAMGALIAIPLAAAVVAIVDTYGHRYELIPELRP